MNPETELQRIGNELFKAAESATDRVNVILHHDSLVVATDEKFTMPIKVIASYKADEIRQGLTIQQWNNLRRSMAKALKKKP